MSDMVVGRLLGMTRFFCRSDRASRLSVRFIAKHNLKSAKLNSHLGLIKQVVRLVEPDLQTVDSFILIQLPFLLGVPILEKLAPSIASIFVGRTGSQLFLTDGEPNKPPLVLRMASDCEDGKFMSALGAFRCRIIYANVSFDHMVGWRTSSIRRETELFKPPRQSLDGYKHVVDVQYCPPNLSEGTHFPPEAAQIAPSPVNAVDYHEIMEEEMIRGLQQLGWKKVDVSFHSAFLPFFAHNYIHVKNEWLHNSGAGVIAHVADSVKQGEMQQDSTSLHMDDQPMELYKEDMEMICVDIDGEFREEKLEDDEINDDMIDDDSDHEDDMIDNDNQ
ncbi:hypothetical protein TEA_017916 [Camellia sinensis var. sinensis]|uniref:DUF676 domain-containing protein n=1 Tax=Camellia sinensis var. sinensis TaxID=542762 RepID=A0A4S4DIK8_CAMSN|nr:hypothetical protein TEA_017916 [Camellia sinensis var. sinensis]